MNFETNLIDQEFQRQKEGNDPANPLTSFDKELDDFVVRNGNSEFELFQEVDMETDIFKTDEASKVKYIAKQKRSKLYHFKVIRLRQYEDVRRENEAK